MILPASSSSFAALLQPLRRTAPQAHNPLLAAAANAVQLFHASPAAHGDNESSLSSGESKGQLYGREDRDPLPAPSDSLKNEEGAGLQEGRPETTPEHAYPIQNDPSTPGTGSVGQQGGEQLKEDESQGPKAAGQGKVEHRGGATPDSVEETGPTQQI